MCFLKLFQGGCFKRTSTYKGRLQRTRFQGAEVSVLGLQSLEADLVVWTAGSQPATKAQRNLKLPFPTTPQGAMKTDETLQVSGHPRVFALGDVASTSGTQQHASLPATAQVATSPV